MVDIKFSVPIIGKIIAYIYDFFTYKRKYNIIIAFSKIEKYNDDYYFSITLNNNTDFNIEINKIIVKTGTLLRLKDVYTNPATFKREYNYIDMYFFQKEVLLFPKNKKSQEISMELKYTGQKTYIFIEYVIKDIKSNIFLPDKRTFKKMIPL